MITKQEVINLALMRLGNKKLKDVDDAYINNVYGIGKRKLLSLDYWSFAQRGVQLPLIDDSSLDTPQHKYKYNLPADYANIIKIYRSGVIEHDYVVMGNYLYSQYSPLWIVYTSNNYSDDERLPEVFGDALSYWIAKETCGVMGNPNALPTLTQQYQQALQEAQAVNGRDVPSQVLHSSYYLDSRY